MSKKEMLRELLEKMDEKEAGLLYCFAIGVRETQSKHETYTSREREEKRNDCTVEREQRAGK